MSFSTLVRTVAKDAKNIWDPYPIRRFMRRHRCIFVHIPKNGGTSVLTALGARQSRMHIPWFTFRESNRFLFESYYKFAITRNPFDRAVSTYTYLIQGGSPTRDAELSQMVKDQCPSFRDFVMDFLTPARICMHNLFRPQAYWVCDVFGTLRVDELYRLESIDAQAPELFKRLGVKNLQLPQVNRSKRKPLATYYDDESIDRVRELYDCDFRWMNYPTEFPSEPQSSDAEASAPGEQSAE